ncbi:amino acid permease-like protein 5 [Sarcoptes scabiei]|nr:amino acid permease-like protein 5 [Sarcoptes scabiei]
MASDGVIFRSLSEVNSRTQTPILATLVSGIFAGLMAALFEVKELADMMSIGTLLAYTLVAMSVIILRFNHEIDEDNVIDVSMHKISDIEMRSKQMERNSKTTIDDNDQRSIMMILFNTDGLEAPTLRTSRFSTNLIIIITFILILLDGLLVHLEDRILSLDTGSLLLISLLLLILLLSMASLTLQPRSLHKVSFEVPWVPFIPVLSMFVNFYLMFKLSSTTWIRFGVWMGFGLSIYFLYGIWNSNERSQAINVSKQRENPRQSTKTQDKSIEF